uniref:DNA/RNA helicase n=2 Tax=Paenibacillus athensensis TaxID=1967502 RepID=A0A4Y8Q5H4_9BACL
MSTYEQILQACQGRSLLAEELCLLLEHLQLNLSEAQRRRYLQLGLLRKQLKLETGLRTMYTRIFPSIWRKEEKRICRRCGSSELYMANCIECGQLCPYCEACLTMGRVRSCSFLLSGYSPPHADLNVATAVKPPSPEACLDGWGLSPAQYAASSSGLHFMATLQKPMNSDKELAANMRRFLIWAVTGAGKTEMIFPFIQYAIASGQRVLVATPRKDVVLELQPRLGRAFAAYKVVTLYGGSAERWERGDITLATTHQLLRLDAAFDLVIIDEIDAFPFHNNPMLEYAAERVCKPQACTVLLSATPPRSVRRAAWLGRMAHAKVPVRYHRKPLPVPGFVPFGGLQKAIDSGGLPAVLLRKLQASLQRGAQVFVFVPAIRLVDPLLALLRNCRELSDWSEGMEGTSSKDGERGEKVIRFREKQARLLVTTTILERGVTVPKSDVFILDADSGLFDEASLIQMAGRAGRSKDDPAGIVCFAARETTRSQREAVRQIKQMNRIARRHGYLETGDGGA